MRFYSCDETTTPGWYPVQWHMHDQPNGENANASLKKYELSRKCHNRVKEMKDEEVKKRNKDKTTGSQCLSLWVVMIGMDGSGLEQ
uniref:Uncharacterized protein n=1 Tax=Pristionchus pacificus TaxID=54126 RepID=A0A2A6CDN9_PRIPA|eukprot:PDM76121.1 hypothetical protein PRIPAC_39725 [Pristionchus pacificus]